MPERQICSSPNRVSRTKEGPDVVETPNVVQDDLDRQGANSVVPLGQPCRDERRPFDGDPSFVFHKSNPRSRQPSILNWSAPRLLEPTPRSDTR